MQAPPPHYSRCLPCTRRHTHTLARLLGSVLEEGEVVAPTPPTNFPNGITVGPTTALHREPELQCGPALRLTASKAKMSGAAWYNRKMQVREGFDTSFQFRLSDPSTACKFLDDAYTHCR